MIGELAERSEVWNYYKTPVPVKLKVTEHVFSEIFSELSFRAVCGDKKFTATVPQYVFDADDRTVEGMAIGKQGDQVVVIFAPTQNDRETLLLPEEMLERAR